MKDVQSHRIDHIFNDDPKNGVGLLLCGDRELRSTAIAVTDYQQVGILKCFLNII